MKRGTTAADVWMPRILHQCDGKIAYNHPMLFSERSGLSKVRDMLQVGSLDVRTRTAIWNALHKAFFEVALRSYDDDYVEEYSDALDALLPQLWERFYGARLDQLHKYPKRNIATVESWFFDERTPWYGVLDIVEFICTNVSKRIAGAIARSVNEALQRESTGYRVIKGVIAQITDDSEVTAIEDAFATTGLIAGAQEHIRRALQLLSDRRNPDFRNAIKEAISGVEAVCQVIVGMPSASLGDAIKAIEQRTALHPAFKRALNSLYGYTSDADGVRHAMLDVPNLTHADAKFMVVTCCAFINYIFEKARALERGT